MQSVNSQTLYYRAMICIRGTSHGTASVRLSQVGVLLKRLNKVKKVKGKVFPYSLPSVGPGADPGVQAVSPQVT